MTEQKQKIVHLFLRRPEGIGKRKLNMIFACGKSEDFEGAGVEKSVLHYPETEIFKCVLGSEFSLRPSLVTCPQCKQARV